MKKHFLLLVGCALVSNLGWTAPEDRGDSPREEKIGLGGGAAVGAVAGGPVGFIVGAALGGWLGDKFHRGRVEREDLQEQVARALADGDSLEELLQGSKRELRDLRTAFSSAEAGFRDALLDALEVEVFFHTGVATLDEVTEERLTRLGSVMQVIDGFSVVIEGHADARGDAEYNEQLSAARAAAVRDALVKAGLGADKITSSAAGEQFSVAEEDDLDALALERRVSLSVIDRHPDNRLARQ